MCRPQLSLTQAKRTLVELGGAIKNSDASASSSCAESSPVPEAAAWLEVGNLAFGGCPLFFCFWLRNGEHLPSCLCPGEPHGAVWEWLPSRLFLAAMQNYVEVLNTFLCVKYPLFLYTFVTDIAAVTGHFLVAFVCFQ